MKYRITTQKELRKRFREVYPDLIYKRFKCGNEMIYPATTRSAFVDWIDHFQKSGVISEKLAQRATL